MIATFGEVGKARGLIGLEMIRAGCSKRNGPVSNHAAAISLQRHRVRHWCSRGASEL